MLVSALLLQIGDGVSTPSTMYLRYVACSSTVSDRVLWQDIVCHGVQMQTARGLQVFIKGIARGYLGIPTIRACHFRA